MRIQTLIKQPSEGRLYAMDFAGLLANDEGIATIDSVAAAPAGLVFEGVTSIAGTLAQQKISGGTTGIKYVVTMVITTSLGNVLEGEGILQVKNL